MQEFSLACSLLCCVRLRIEAVIGSCHSKDLMQVQIVGSPFYSVFDLNAALAKSCSTEVA